MKSKGRAAKRRTKSANIEVELGSGNVFADLGLPDPEESMLKANLVFQIAQLIDKKKLTQAKVAERTGLDQPKVSRLLRGHLDGFSADRLFSILNRLGHSIEVRISAKERPPGKSHTRVLVE